MKKNLIILSLIAFAIFSALTGCKKDKNESVSIVGKWECVSASNQSFIDGQLNNTNEETMNPGEVLLELKSNKTGTLQGIDLDDNNVTISGSYTITGNRIKMMGNGGDEVLDAEFSLTNNNNTLILKYTDEETRNGKVLRYVLTEVYKRK